MDYNLIPYPISILFIVVFGLACLAVLWKLHRRVRFYSVLFGISLAVFLVTLLLTITTLIA